MEFILRPWQEEDASSVAAVANNPHIAANLRDAFPFPYSEADAMAYVAMCRSADERQLLLRAIVVNGVAVGSIGLILGSDVYRKSAELGYWLAEPFWGKGIVSRAVAQICDEGLVCWDIVRIFAEPYARNVGSRRVLEKAGFTLEGIMCQGVVKGGELLDCCMYAKLAH